MLASEDCSENETREGWEGVQPMTSVQWMERSQIVGNNGAQFLLPRSSQGRSQLLWRRERGMGKTLGKGDIRPGMRKEVRRHSRWRKGHPQG